MHIFCRSQSHLAYADDLRPYPPPPTPLPAVSYREEEEAEAEAEKGLEYRESNTLEEDILVAVVETWGKKRPAYW